MNTEEFLNAIYDVIAQNPITQDERQELLNLVNYVDTERDVIVFKNEKGYEFELRLTAVYAPSSAIEVSNE